MLEMFLLMVAVAIQSAPGDGPGPGGGIALAGVAAAPAAEAPPAFPAPSSEPDTEAPPVFLAPSSEPATEAPPVFLAPAPEDQAEAAPSFPAPAAPAPQAEPQTPSGRFTTATEVRPILSATRANWIAVREFDGKDLVYVTQLWSWRCGLAELRIGINGAAPQVWPLPPCHLDQPAPNMIQQTDGLPYAEFPLGAVQSVEVQITYDDLGTDSARFNRQGVLIP